jgi:hypothetical protein
MRRRWLGRSAAIVVLAAGCTLVPAVDASAGPGKLVCGAIGLISGAAGRGCNVARQPGKLIGAGKKLIGGHVGGAVKTILGDGASSVSSTATTALGLAAIGAWVTGGARFALEQTAKVLNGTTSPRLTETWFSAAYWRVAGIAALLTLPLLFAAAAQALMRSDVTLLARSALGYLPLSLLAVSVAAPLTMLLLAASDEMSTIVSSAGGGASSINKVLAGAGATSLLERSPFILFLVAAFSAAGAILLWVELALREAAVYVVVLMLPLAFAALVWPARRIWAIRAVELLVALILSKFAIVAVLTLGSAALGHSSWTGVSGQLVGLVLLLLGVFTPWALLKLLPLHELASGAIGSLRSASGAGLGALAPSWANADQATHSVDAMTEQLGHTAADSAAREAATAEAERLRANQAADPARAPEPAAVQPVDLAAANGGGQADDGSGSAPTGGADGGSANPPDRVPGMPEMWQQPDGSWRELVLGPAAGEHQQLWPGDPPPGDDPASEPPRQGQPPGDDRDPLPPEQPPEDGHL